jgi:gas vesicle protein
MDKKQKSKKGVEAKTVVGIGAGVAALGAAAYLLFGPNGKKNQKTLRGWTVKMKGEIIEKFEQAKELTEPVYHDIVSKVEAKYAKLKNIKPEELAEIVQDIKKQWKSIAKESKKTTPKKTVRKVAKK